MAAPDLSVVVTLLNEQGSVDELYRRTVTALDGKPFELIFVDDGSTDGTWAAVERLHAADPRVRAVRFKRNFGQHPAMHAGLARARGDIVVTMDGDLQNEPEDIPRLVAAVEAGADVASGRRVARKDSWGRTLPSRLINGMLRRFTGVAISDFGCAFNAYRRSVVVPMLPAIGKQKFTKALVLSGGASVVEVDVAHAARAGPLALLAAAPDAARAARARRLLAAADPVDRDRARRRLHARSRPRSASTGSGSGSTAPTSPARCSAASPCSSCSGSRASSSRSSGSTWAESSARSKGGLSTRSRRNCEQARVSSPAAPASSRRTSSATCWRTPTTRSSRSTRSPTRATSRTSPT